jgi:hypothetical protein
MKFKRFTKTSFLKQIGRPLLARFIERFATELANRNVRLPDPQCADEDYYQRLAGLALAPDGLPDHLIEAMFEIEELATPEGQERLETTAAQAGIPLSLAEESSHADIAMQAWLAHPALVARSHNEVRLHRLSAFQYFGSKAPVDRSGSFTVPDGELIRRLTADLDRWFAGHNRGHETTQVVAYPIEGEVWFVIRHGDTFSRMPMVKGREVTVLHFRPTKDDVVVYATARDEIRIHARTKGERELYRTAFGRCLFGDDQHFSERKAYTLSPLRAEGVDALDCTGNAGIGSRSGGRLVKAVLDVYFANARRSRTVEIRPPNVLKVRRQADSGAVQRWLSERGFRSELTESAAPTESERQKAGWVLRIGNRVVTSAERRAHV